MEESTEKNRVVHVCYRVEALVPPEQAIGGNAYWTPLKLMDGRRETDNLQLARMNLGSARAIFGNGNVRLVMETRTVIDF